MNGMDATTKLFKENVEEIGTRLNLIKPDVMLTYNDVVPAIPTNDADSMFSSYNIIETVGQASVAARRGEYKKMEINGEEVNYKLRFVGTSYKLDKADIRMSNRDKGIKLDSNTALRARNIVEQKLNKLVYLGDVDFGYQGVLGLTGVTTKTASAVLSATNVYTVIKNAIEAIPEEFQGMSYNFVMAPVEYNQLLNRNANTDKIWLTMLNESFPNVTFVKESDIKAANTYYDGSTTQTIAAGTAVIVPFSSSMLWRKVSIPIKNTPSSLDLLENEVHKPDVKYTVDSKTSMVEAAFPTAVVLVTGLAS